MLPLNPQETDTRDLRHLGFRRFAAPVALAPYVQCFWVIYCQPLLDKACRETLYPDGGSGIIFNFGSPYALGNVRHTERILYQGCDIQRALIGLEGRVDAIGIRFTPGGAYRCLGIPMHDLHQQQLALSELGVTGLEELYEQLATRQALPERLHYLSRWLQTLFESAPQVQPLNGLISRLIDSTKPSSPQQLAEAQGISRRKLERLFKAQVGIAPGILQRLYRASTARDLIKINPGISLTEVAQQCGYFDQAHFIRHFRAVVGQTPGAYRRRKQLPQIYNS